MSNLLVSIITPSYNQGKFIEEAILSVKSQDYLDIEHIIIDGYSTDNTLDILNKYKGSYNLKWLSERDKGIADAVNKGFQMANGEIVGWLNADDVYFNKGVVSKVVNLFRIKKDIDILFGDCAFISEDNTILRVQCNPKFSFDNLLRGCFISQPAVFFRKQVIKEHKLDLSLKYAVDYEYWLRLGKRYNFYHMPCILAADRNHLGRISIKNEAQLKREAEQLKIIYRPKSLLRLRVVWLIHIIISGIPRRFKGLFYIIYLKNKSNFAFRCKIRFNLTFIRNQLLPPSLKNLKT